MIVKQEQTQIEDFDLLMEAYFAKNPIRRYTLEEFESIFTPTVLESSEEAGQDLAKEGATIEVLESNEETRQDLATANIVDTHPQVGLDERIGVTIEQEIPESTLNDNNGSQSTSNGAFIDSKEQVVKKSVKVGKVPVTSADFRAQGHINDKNWTLSKLASKFTSLGQFTWSISQTPGTVIKFWNLPNDILVTPALRTPFDVTAYERFKSIRFKITTSASPFYAGRLICGFYPFFQETTGMIANSQLLLTQLGGVVINPVDNQTYEVPIPYRHYLDWLEYPHDCLGQFAVVVLNQLQTGPDNVNNVVISVFVTIEEAQFKVPEFVSSQTKSMRVMASKPQGDDEDTAITISKHISNINEDWQENFTMLCAGTGIYQEPKIKHFPDHPHDLVQLLKRDRPFAPVYQKLPAFNINEQMPGIAQMIISFSDIVEELGGRYLAMFELWRGSIVIRGDIFGDNAAANTDNNWIGKMYFVNDVANVPSVANGGMYRQQLMQGINYGYHKFDNEHPPSCTLPYWAPNFVARNRGEAIVYQTPISALVIEFYNYSVKESVVTGVLEGRLDDDFAMGCFTGMPPLERRNAIRKTRTPMQSNGWALLNMFSSEESGIIDAVGSVVNGVSDFVEIAANNLRPVREVSDLIGSMLDAPAISLQPTPMMPRKWNYGNANNMLQYAEKLGNTNHNGASYSDSSAFGSDKLETDMYHIMQNVKTLISTITWTTSDPAGKLLVWWPVGPTRESNMNKVASPIEYFARDFNYWAGSLIYALDVVASQMHTGRLILSYHPNLTSAQIPGFTMDMATQQYFISFDLDKGKGCVVASVPYLYKSPFRVVTPLAGDLPTSFDVNQCYGGIVALWVMNPLRASTTVSQKVDINIYKVAGKDFRFEGYGSALNASFR